jgi:hypothetical protein
MKQYAVQIDGKTCECSDAFGTNCVAWCTDKRMPDMELRDGANPLHNDVIHAACSQGKRAISCNLKPNQNFYATVLQYTTGYVCICYDYQDGKCFATCASNIKNYETVISTGINTLSPSCIRPGNKILSCGIYAMFSLVSEYLLHYHQVKNETSCECFSSSQNYTCYAVCGTLT